MNKYLKMLEFKLCYDKRVIDLFKKNYAINP